MISPHSHALMTQSSLIASSREVRTGLDRMSTFEGTAARLSMRGEVAVNEISLGVGPVEERGRWRLMTDGSEPGSSGLGW